MGQTGTKQEAFWESCSYGREWKVRQMLTSGGVDVNWVSHVHQSCPIHVASQGKPEIVRLLLEAGCRVDARDSKQNTALHQASMTGQEEIVRMLLAAGADPNAVNDRGWSPLIMACYFCQPSVVRCLLEAGADYRLKNSDGRSCLHELCRAAPKSQICQNGKRVSTASLDQSPLYAAVMPQIRQEGVTGAQRQQLDQYQNMQQQMQLMMLPDWPLAGRSNNGNPGRASAPLDRSRFARALVDIAEFLLAPGRCPDLAVDDRSRPQRSGARGEADFTPLMFAVYHGHLPLAKCLLDHGADVGAADMSGWTALHWAVNRELKSAAELLISYGANPERQSLRGETPMDLANDDPELRLLLMPIYPEIVSNGHVTTDDEEESEEEAEAGSGGGGGGRGRRMLANAEDLLD